MSVSADDLVWYPRAFVVLATSVQNGDHLVEVDTGIQPVKASVSRNTHSQATTAEVTVRGSALPFDPRQIGGINIALYIGAVDTIGGEIVANEHLQFVGYCDGMRRTRDEKGPVVELKARDMTALLRDFKPIPRDAMPRYSDTVESAINRVLDVIPNVTAADGSKLLTLVTSDLTSLQVGGAVHSRFRNAALQLPPETTAWQAIEHVCGLASLNVMVRLGQIIVRRTIDVDARGDVATIFTFGGEDANLLSVGDEKKFVRNRKGVQVLSFDPATRERIVAIYPRDADLLPSHRPRAQLRRTFTTTRRVRRGAPAAAVQDRDVFDAYGIHSQDALDRYAELLYRERSSQEIEGTLITPIWTPEILALDNGDRFKLSIDPELAAGLRNATSRQAMVQMLVERLDVNKQAANALIDASLDRPSDVFFARTVTHEFEADGRSTTTVGFMNILEVSPNQAHA